MTRMVSKRPARLSLSPDCMSSGAEPRMTTRRGQSRARSASHSPFTVSDHPSIFWISSRTSTDPRGDRSALLSGRVPLAHQPFRVPLRVQSEGGRILIVRGGESGDLGLVDREVAAFEVDPAQGLAGDGGLAGLARAEEGDDVAGRLGQALDERVDLGALEGFHAREITLLSKNTQ